MFFWFAPNEQHKRSGDCERDFVHQDKIARYGNERQNTPKTLAIAVYAMLQAVFIIIFFVKVIKKYRIIKPCVKAKTQFLI